MLAVGFLFCLLVHLFQGVLFPGISLLSFSPFFALCCMKTTLKSTLWLAALAGFCIDLLSDDPMGLHSLNYTMTAAFFYSLRWRFSSEEPLHLGVYTLLISSSSTLLQLILLFLFDRRVPVNGFGSISSACRCSTAYMRLFFSQLRGFFGSKCAINGSFIV